VRLGPPWRPVTLLAIAILPTATPADPPAKDYTRALIQEAALEDAVRTLRAAMTYARAADIEVTGAEEELDQQEEVLDQLRLSLQADGPSPALGEMAFDDTLAASARALQETREATDTLRQMLRTEIGDWPRQPRFRPLPTLDLDDPNLTGRLAFGALAPSQQWSQQVGSWDMLHALGFQLLSPFFGQYWADPETQAVDAPRIDDTARRLEEAGFPLLVWLEPEYNIGSLWDEIGEEMFLHDAEGRWQKRTRIHNTINVFHPRVREEMCAWLERLGASHRGDRRVLGYELVEESALRFDTSEPDSAAIEPTYGGYSKAAVASFRGRLRGKYVTIGRLNELWGTGYESFDAVTPPAALARREGQWEGPEVPLLVEFQEFRAAEHAECFRQMVDALHRGNPGRPVIPQFVTPMFGDPLGGVDLFRMGEAGWDIITFHTDAAFPYIHSIADYQDRPIWNDEYIWSARVPRSETGERELRAQAAIALWRNLIWGARGFVLFNLDFSWDHPKDGGDWNNNLLNAITGYQTPRYAAGVFAQVLPKAQALFDELYHTKVEDEGVMILEPTTSVYAAVPTGTAQWWARRITQELLRGFYRPAFCPERYVISGREDLSGVRVMVLPPAPYVPDALAEKLADWTDRGGVLVTLGPFATHDAFGKSRPPEAPFAGRQPGGEWAMGAGRHISIAFGGTPDDIASAVRGAVDAAVGPRAATAADDRVELMLRRAADGRSLLVALDTDTDEPVDGEVFVRGDYDRVTDVSAEGGIGVPILREQDNLRIPVRLDPGEARVFLLD